MKKLILAFAVVLMMMSLTGKIFAQATENTAAGAVIITPITITETSALHFGVMDVLEGSPLYMSFSA